MDARRIALAIGLLAFPTLAPAQRPGGYGRGDRPQGPPDSAAMARMRDRRMAAMQPVGMLIENRAEIGLSDDQVARLTRLRDQLDAQNRPLIARLDTLRPRFGPRPDRDDGRPGDDRARDDRAGPPPLDQLAPAQRDSLIARRKAAADLMMDIRENNRQARKAAMQILTPVQQQRADGLEARLREEMREFGGPDGRGRRGPPGGAPPGGGPPMGGPPEG